MEVIKKIILASCLFWIATIHITDLSRLAANSFFTVFETYEKIIGGLNSYPDSEKDSHLILNIELDDLLSVDGLPQYRIIPAQKMLIETHLIEQGALEPEAASGNAAEIVLQIQGENTSYNNNHMEFLDRRSETRKKIILVIFR